jgi:hypothetical protein
VPVRVIVELPSGVPGLPLLPELLFPPPTTNKRLKKKTVVAQNRGSRHLGTPSRLPLARIRNASERRAMGQGDDTQRQGLARRVDSFPWWCELRMERVGSIRRRTSDGRRQTLTANASLARRRSASRKLFRQKKANGTADLFGATLEQVKDGSQLVSATVATT